MSVDFPGKVVAHQLTCRRPVEIHQLHIKPTDFFTGSEIDARYYTAHFAALSDPATASGLALTYRNPTTDRQLHILDRQAAA